MQVCGAYWANAAQSDIFLRSFKRIADQSGPEAGKVIWLSLRRYPALVLLYGLGLGALANANYRFLKTLFDLKLRVDSYKPNEQTATTLYDQKVLARDAQKILPGREREYTPLSTTYMKFCASRFANTCPTMPCMNPPSIGWSSYSA
jgi:hypothetical protein